VGKHQATWTRSDLIFAVSQALPANLGVPVKKIRPLLEGIADKALKQAVVVVATEEVDEHTPATFRLANGLSSYQRPGSAKYATPGQMVHERIIDRAAVRTGAATLTKPQVEAMMQRLDAAGVQLRPAQEAAVKGVATSGAFVEVLEAPAGTGKSFVVGTLTQMWANSGRRVIGLTPTQIAADVLSEEGVTAFNIEKWRVMSARDSLWQLRRGDLVVIDEAGMVSTEDIADIVRRCEKAGAKLLLVGDRHQLTAVGPGGALADVGETGIRYELAEVRRFSHAWEGEASLRLRDGDVSVLADYDKQGRLRACGTAEQAAIKASRAWLADTLAGRRSLLLVGTNEMAAQVNADLRAELVRLGRVEAQGVALGMEGTVAGVGDLIQARENDWQQTIPVINRQTFRVIETHEDGSLQVERSDGKTLTLPAKYVAEHVTLAYASTVNAAQGRTVDTAHGVVDKID